MDTRVLYAAFDVVPSPKGASTHITYFARGLLEAGFQVQLITAGDPALPERDTYCGAPILRVPAGAEASFLQRAVDFGQAVMSHLEVAPPYTVAHFRSHWCGLPIVRARPRFGYRTLFEVNGLPSVELKYHYPGLAGNPLEARIKEQEMATLLLADAVICPSAVTRAYLASLGVPRERITVIPNGVDTRLFQPRPRQSAGGPPTILYAGTLADWQGLPALIDALPIILGQCRVKLRIVGRGRGRQHKELLKRIRRLGLEEAVAVEPAVPHHELPAAIAQADVCVAPLAYNDRNVTQGCCPLKLLEYMACGRAIAASNLPVVRELAREGVDALLFTPDDPADIARCILALLNDAALAGRLGAAAARRARDRFGWRAAQKKLLGVYARLMDGG